MNKRKMLIMLLLLPLAAQGQTLEQCQEAARANYPMIEQYDLIGKTTKLTVANLSKGWLPQVSLQAQATYQSDVTAWPSEMQALMQQMGVEMEGLGKGQYRIGIDVQQTLYDGGAIASAKEVARRQGALDEAQNEVAMYQVRQRVNELYFGLLLADERLRLNDELQKTLQANEQKLRALWQRGVVSESDYQTVRAERLGTAQQGTLLQSQRATLAKMLSAFCGMTVDSPSMPATLAERDPKAQRPELKAIDAQIALSDAMRASLDAALMPRLSLFASGFYGYPGYNMFHDMMSHQWSLNGMVGARLSWSIGKLYTRKGDLSKLRLQRQMAENSRQTFLFNNDMEQTRHDETLASHKQLLDADDEIIALRSAIRQAAESKMSHGTIDAGDLVKEINAENSARLQRSIHHIEMLKAMYDLQLAQGQ